MASQQPCKLKQLRMSSLRLTKAHRKTSLRLVRQMCCTAVPQVVVVALLVSWGSAWQAGAIGLLLAVQLWLMQRLLADPRGKAPWYNGTGTTLYVLGMLFAAFALRPVLP